MIEIEHENTQNIVCPYCGWEDTDSWEQTPNNGEAECARCGKTFHYERDITVDYSTMTMEEYEKIKSK